MWTDIIYWTGKSFVEAKKLAQDRHQWKELNGPLIMKWRETGVSETASFSDRSTASVNIVSNCIV